MLRSVGNPYTGGANTRTSETPYNRDIEDFTNALNIDWSAPMPSLVPASIEDAYNDESSSGSNFADSDDTSMVDYTYPIEPVYNSSYIGYPLAATGVGRPTVVPKVGAWYGPNNDKLYVNKRFLDIVFECERHFTTRPGYQGTKEQTRLLWDFLRRALESIGLGDRLQLLETTDSIHSPVRTAVLISPAFVKTTHTEINERVNDTEGWDSIRLKLQAGPYAINNFGSLRGGTAPVETPGPERREYIKNLKRGFCVRWTPTTKEWGRLEKDTELPVEQLGDNIKSLPLQRPFMYPGDDMGKELRDRHSSELRAVIDAHRQQYNSIKTETVIPRLRSRKSNNERVIETSRKAVEKFLTNHVKETENRTARFLFKSRNAGNEAFHKVLQNAWAVRVLGLIQIAITNRQFELNIGGVKLEDVLQAELSYLRALKMHDQIWREYDTFRSAFWIEETDAKAKAKADQRIKLRRQLDACWDLQIVQVEAALQNLNQGKPKAPPRAPPQVPPQAPPQAPPQVPVPESPQQRTAGEPASEPASEPKIVEITDMSQLEYAESQTSTDSSVSGEKKNNIRPLNGRKPPIRSKDKSKPRIKDEAIEDEGVTGSKENPIVISASKGKKKGGDDETDNREAVDKRAKALAQEYILDFLRKTRELQTDALEKTRKANDELDPEDPGDHQAIQTNNINIMSSNQQLWQLDVAIENAQGRDWLEEEGMKFAMKHKYKVAPAHEYWRDTMRIQGRKDLPTSITSYAPGNMPGHHPLPGLPRVLIGAVPNFGGEPLRPDEDENAKETKGPRKVEGIDIMAGVDRPKKQPKVEPQQPTAPQPPTTAPQPPTIVPQPPTIVPQPPTTIPRPPDIVFQQSKPAAPKPAAPKPAAPKPAAPKPAAPKPPTITAPRPPVIVVQPPTETLQRQPKTPEPSTPIVPQQPTASQIPSDARIGNWFKRWDSFTYEEYLNTLREHEKLDEARVQSNFKAMKEFARRYIETHGLIDRAETGERDPQPHDVVLKPEVPVPTPSWDPRKPSSGPSRTQWDPPSGPIQHRPWSFRDITDLTFDAYFNSLSAEEKADINSARENFNAIKRMWADMQAAHEGIGAVTPKTPVGSEYMNKHPQLWTWEEWQDFGGDFDAYKRTMSERGQRVPEGARKEFASWRDKAQGKPTPQEPPTFQESPQDDDDNMFEEIEDVGDDYDDSSDDDYVRFTSAPRKTTGPPDSHPTGPTTTPTPVFSVDETISTPITTTGFPIGKTRPNPLFPVDTTPMPLFPQRETKPNPLFPVGETKPNPLFPLGNTKPTPLFPAGKPTPLFPATDKTRPNPLPTIAEASEISPTATSNKSKRRSPPDAADEPPSKKAKGNKPAPSVEETIVSPRAPVEPPTQPPTAPAPDRGEMDVDPNSDGWPSLKYLICSYRTAHLAEQALGQRPAAGAHYAAPLSQGQPGYPVPLLINGIADL
ncbi:hypothetical protein F4776DRAFT_116426 [Hypoxylon sp. NC0597]|nr:hypothetical protein F4776DRAFT_116426 [Hypoxylon sp. NC0597]